jgi:hypothetical protein
MVSISRSSKEQSSDQPSRPRLWLAADEGKSVWRTFTGLLALLLMTCGFAFFPWQLVADAAEKGSSLPTGHPSPTVTVRAASGATIRFRTQNGEKVDGVPPETVDVPYLVLRRNGALTDLQERTLLVEVTGIAVPPAGVTVTLTIQTQHGDPDSHTDSPPRIQVWHESQRIFNASRNTQADVTVVLEHVFDETVLAGAGAIATPTDYFRYDVVVTDALHPATNPRYTFSRDSALLMENLAT